MNALTRRATGFLLGVALLAVHERCVAAAGRPPYVGMWGIWGGENQSTEGRPWLKGTMVARRWEQIEPEPNKFDFSKLDDGLQKAVSNGYPYLMFKIYTGMRTPKWVYDHGVPLVTTDSPAPRRRNYPFYLDPEFKAYFKRMIRRTAAHVKRYPPEIRNRIISVQCPIGKSSDGNFYHGKPVDPRYNISRKQAIAYQKELFTVYCDAYKDTDPPIVPLLNPGYVHEWLKANYPRTWRKYSFAGHFYQHHKVRGRYFKPLIRDATQYQDGWAMLARDECSNQRRGYWREAPAWNVYWTLTHALHWGLDFVNMMAYRYAKPSPQYIAAFERFNAYAGVHHPAESPGAWIALRDGLDSADTNRFPEELYGKREDPTHPRGKWHQGTGKERYVNIANAFAAYGARQGDNEHMPVGTCDSQHLGKMNDVAWECLRGNFRMYLRQHDPHGTSQGWWRVGSSNQPYGRFARGFNHAKGWDTMWFDLDDGFFTARPAAGHTINVRVVYFDQGTGKWQLRYDAVDDPGKTACTVTKTDSGLWKEKTLTLRDAYLGNRCPNRTDFMLVSADDKDDIFHMLEITRSGR